MKRNKHILINLNEDQYNALLLIAEKQQRKTADAAYLLLLNSINNEIIKICDIKTSFEKLKY